MCRFNVIRFSLHSQTLLLPVPLWTLDPSGSTLIQSGQNTVLKCFIIAASCFQHYMCNACCFTCNGWQLNDRLCCPLLPVYLQQRKSGGLRGQRAEHNGNSLPAAQPDQDSGGRVDSVFEPDHALPFPRGQSRNILACVCVFRQMPMSIFLCAWKVCLNIPLTFLFFPGCLLSAAVFQLQCTADPAGLLCVPPHQQHREAGSDAAHPIHFPPAGGVASGGLVWQRRPSGHCQHPVSPLLGTHAYTIAYGTLTLSQLSNRIVQLQCHNTVV